jgi:hypothetical protein
MKLFTCDTCGKIDHLILNGNLIGDRELDGLYLEVELNDDDTYSISIDPDDRPICRNLGLDQRKLVKDAEEYVKQADILTCPFCDGDVDLPNAVPKIGKMLTGDFSFNGVLEDLKKACEQHPSRKVPLNLEFKDGHHETAFIEIPSKEQNDTIRKVSDKICKMFRKF